MFELQKRSKRKSCKTDWWSRAVVNIRL